MRIGSRGEQVIQAQKINVAPAKVEVPKVENKSIETSQVVKTQVTEEQKDVVSKSKLEEAVESINEFLNTQNKSSKFVFHEGLDKYYVKLVDAETDEVIKEIPPETLLNAFYEMKKLAGMIVDEKI